MLFDFVLPFCIVLALMLANTVHVQYIVVTCIQNHKLPVSLSDTVRSSVQLKARQLIEIPTVVCSAGSFFYVNMIICL